MIGKRRTINNPPQLLAHELPVNYPLTSPKCHKVHHKPARIYHIPLGYHATFCRLSLYLLVFGLYRAADERKRLLSLTKMVTEGLQILSLRPFLSRPEGQD